MLSLRSEHLQIICSMDKLSLLSWNVQGLGGQTFPRFKGLLRADLDKANVGDIDILLLQGHHLSADRLQSYGPSCQADGYIFRY